MPALLLRLGQLPQPLLLLLEVLWLSLSSTDAKIFQNGLYSDHMVLQAGQAYDVRPFVAGWGDTVGEAVTVTFSGQSYYTTVLDDLTWEVQMNSCETTTNKTLEVRGTDTQLVYRDVVCGQVFVCSGQSNSTFGVRGFADQHTTRSEHRATR